MALNFVAVPRDSKQYGVKGWLFAILARTLEDSGELEYKKKGSRFFCRSIKPWLIDEMHIAIAPVLFGSGKRSLNE